MSVENRLNLSIHVRIPHVNDYDDKKVQIYNHSTHINTFQLDSFICKIYKGHAMNASDVGNTHKNKLFLKCVMYVCIC